MSEKTLKIPNIQVSRVLHDHRITTELSVKADHSTLSFMLLSMYSRMMLFDYLRMHNVAQNYMLKEVCMKCKNLCLNKKYLRLLNVSNKYLKIKRW